MSATTNGTLIDNVVDVLMQGGGARYKNVTFGDTSGNKFTLLDTPRLWDQSATVTVPSDACMNLVLTIRKTAGSATKLLDISILWMTGVGLPGGHFQLALSQAFRDISRANQTPFVRILVGVPTPVVVLDSDLERWLQQTIELNGNQRLADVKFPILIGRTHQSVSSWTHSKIVAVDGSRAVVGGHNLWESAYIGSNPVHDVSGLIEGAAVGAAHKFLTLVWTKPFGNVIQLSRGKFGISNPSRQGLQPRTWSPPLAGQTRMLALGRLGDGVVDALSVGSNASVAARLIAFASAKRSIRMSQQSLYFSPGPGWDFYTLLAIVMAMLDGVNVEIVVSNEVPLADGGYDGYLTTVLSWLTRLYVGHRLGILAFPYSKPARTDVAGWATLAAAARPGGTWVASRSVTDAERRTCLADLNSHLSIAPLYFAAGINYWNVSNVRKPAANHAKVWIIDDTDFYVGSDNLYLSGSVHGLQEFGYLIEGATETGDFVTDYWDPLWKNSRNHVVPATMPGHGV